MKWLVDTLREIETARIRGRVHRLMGPLAEGRGLCAPVGARCEILCRDGRRLGAEVVGFRGEHALIAPYGDTHGLSAGDSIEYSGRVASVRAGELLLGRVVGADGVPLDGKGALPATGAVVPVHRGPTNPLGRLPVERPFVTGLRVIDGMLTVGCGQRMGVFSGSGVGKSVLLGMLARNSRADVVVIGLIGERSREVRDFVAREIDENVLRRTVTVAATAEEPALKRLQAALAALCIAEWFRDQGRDVLLLVDSLTRVAMAQRELGLSMGEPPASRGYPPSVFALLPRLLERAGPGERGTITAFFTVLAEQDDDNDPIVDCSRAALDGHIWLSRSLAERGHFPAVDPLSSVSRVQPHIVSSRHSAAARAVRGMLARYREVEDLVRLGAYVPGRNERTDRAVECVAEIEDFLQQEQRELSAMEETIAGLERLALSSPGSEDAPERGHQTSRRRITGGDLSR